MKITLIAPTVQTRELTAFGVRALSSYMKQQGHIVRLIVLSGGWESQRQGYLYQFVPNFLDDLVALCRGSDLIGFSLMACDFNVTRQMTAHIKKSLNIPIIWGGIHATVRPEESLDYADMALVAEGEGALLELVEKMTAGQKLEDIRNIWFKKGKEIIRNPLRPLLQDMDELPFWDFGLENQYIYCNVKKRIEPLTKELVKHHLPQETGPPHGTFTDSHRGRITYRIMTARGCPHRCTFCAERTLALMYKGQRYLRMRSAEHVIAELKDIVKLYPFIENISLFDDTFPARSTQDTEKFCQLYRQEIGLPFQIQASPTMTTPEKVNIMMDAGLAWVELGVQSVSQTGMETYKRRMSPRVILQAADLFRQHVPPLRPPCYHVILDNPWETADDQLKTLDLLLQIPRPFWMKRSTLMLYPGTELYARAVREGLIKGEEDEQRLIFNRHLGSPQGSYVNFLVYLSGFSYFPRGVIRFLARPRLVHFLNQARFHKLFGGLARVGDALIVASRGIKALVTGDFQRIRNYLQW
jgi:anaerobic magnesium-protoporphyrin IX monomethyl ester cyclase